MRGRPLALLAAVPLFYPDVLPILERRCQNCHRAGEVAPMALQTYEQARPYAKAIRDAVLRHTMPPWFADAPTGTFANDPRLPAAEISVLRRWAYEHGVELDFSRPGTPTDNAKVESFNGRFRQECLNEHWFLSLDDARSKIADWRRYYNESRPHSALQWATPAEFARRARESVLTDESTTPEISTSGRY